MIGTSDSNRCEEHGSGRTGSFNTDSRVKSLDDMIM